MKLKVYEKYDNSTKKGFMIDPSSFYDALKEPYDLKIYECKLKIEGHLKNYLYTDEQGITRSACFISSSYGKDSLVMTILTKQVCNSLNIPMIPVFLNNTLNLYPEEILYWKKINKRYNLQDCFKMFLPPKDENGKQITVWTIREKNKHMENFRNKVNIIYNPKTKRMIKKRSPDCCEILKRESVNNFLMTNGTTYLIDDGLKYQCSFDGRKASENNNRSRNILQRGCTYVTNFERPRPIRTFIPLAYLTDEDRDKFLIDNFVPICPAYEIHELDRMGCRNCVAYKKWIVNLAKEPTGLGAKDLQMNLEFMQKYEPERVKTELLYSLKYLIKSKIKINSLAYEILHNYVILYNYEKYLNKILIR